MDVEQVEMRSEPLAFLSGLSWDPSGKIICLRSCRGCK